MNLTEGFLPPLRISSPCSARWADMAGDERARFCIHCQKHVYNLSAMTSAEVAALIREKEGRFCGRIYQRRDGTILTSDCAVGNATTSFRRFVAAAAAALALTAVSFLALKTARQPVTPGQQDLNRARDFGQRASWQFRELFGLNPPPPPPRPNTIPLPPGALMGEVSIPPPIPIPPPVVPAPKPAGS